MNHCLYLIGNALNLRHAQDVAQIQKEIRHDTMVKFIKNMGASKAVSTWRVTTADESTTPLLLHGEVVIDKLRPLYPFDWNFVFGHVGYKSIYGPTGKEAKLILIAIRNTICEYWPDDPERAECLAEFDETYKFFCTIGRDG